AQRVPEAPVFRRELDRLLGQSDGPARIAEFGVRAVGQQPGQAIHAVKRVGVARAEVSLSEWQRRLVKRKGVAVPADRDVTVRQVVHTSEGKSMVRELAFHDGER